MKHIIAFIIFLMVIIPVSNAQHGDEADSELHGDHGETHHKVTLVMAYSLLKNQIDESTNNILVVPTFGINYDFMFHQKWGVGLHTDLVLQQYQVEILQVMEVARLLLVVFAMT